MDYWNSGARASSNGDRQKRRTDSWTRTTRSPPVAVPATSTASYGKDWLLPLERLRAAFCAPACRSQPVGNVLGSRDR